MGGSKIGEDVRSFLLDEIPSVAHLEILLHLHPRPSDWWSADRMATALRMSSQAVLERMEEMSSRGLFCALALNWTGLAATRRGDEARTCFYVVRLAAFVLIIGAVVDKNRSR
jgi:hypothetical protein